MGQVRRAFAENLPGHGESLSVLRTAINEDATRRAFTVMEAHMKRMAKWLKPLVGTAILGTLIFWVVKEGVLLERISLPVAVLATVASGVINLLNASIVKNIVTVYERKITFVKALHLSVLGTFGNSAGGLPLGTTLKYVLLHRQSGLKVSEITSGLVIFTLATSFFLLCYTAVSVWSTGLSLAAKTAPALIVFMVLLLLPFLWRRLRNRRSIGRLVEPFLRKRNLQRLIAISAITATGFVCSYWLVATFLFPEIPALIILFVASAGTLASLATLLQSVGGIQELSVGLSAYVSGVRLIDGLQIALVLRIASLLSSGLFLALLYAWPRRSVRANAP